MSLKDTSPNPERDTWLIYNLRRLLTGFCWVCFGLGGLLMSLFWFPYLNIAEKDKDRRVLRARKSISASFRLFMKLCDVLAVTGTDLSSIEQLKQAKGTIIVANHPGILDYVIIASQLPQLDCLVKSSLKQNFFLRGVVRVADYLLNDESEELLANCKERLSSGNNILIFPEGTRTVPGKPLHLKRGFAHIALRLRCPVAVLFIEAPEKWLSKHSHWYEIPPKKGVLRIENLCTLNPQDFLVPGEDTYSLASRRLTRHIGQILSQKLILSETKKLSKERQINGFVRK